MTSSNPRLCRICLSEGLTIPHSGAHFPNHSFYSEDCVVNVIGGVNNGSCTECKESK